MPSQNTQKILIGSVFAVIVLLTFIVGFLLTQGNRGSVAPPPQAREAPANPPAPMVAATIINWTPMQNGCTVEETGTKVHILGTNNLDGWANSNGMNGTTEYPVQDFELSVDFMVPKFQGPGIPLVYLQARTENLDYVAIQYRPQANCYAMQRWTKSGQEITPTVPNFHDESTAFHHLRLKYSASAHQTTGWVDDKVIGILNYELTGNMHVALLASSDKAGDQIDLTYDHCVLSLP